MVRGYPAQNVGVVFLGSGLPRAKRRNGLPWVGVTPRKASEWSSLDRGYPFGGTGGGFLVFWAYNNLSGNTQHSTFCFYRPEYQYRFRMECASRHSIHTPPPDIVLVECRWNVFDHTPPRYKVGYQLVSAQRWSVECCFVNLNSGLVSGDDRIKGKMKN